MLHPTPATAQHLGSPSQNFLKSCELSLSLFPHLTFTLIQCPHNSTYAVPGQKLMLLCQI